MVNISILVVKNAVMASIADTRYLFSMVNEFLQQSGKPPKFDVKLISLWDEVKLSDGLFMVRPDLPWSDAAAIRHDLIVVPSMTGDMIRATYLNREYAPWISDQYKSGSEIASLCVGAFLLGYSGLLKGRDCTTHWLYANDFRKFYPSVNLVDEKVITDQNGLYSSGGNNAYWNLLLHLIEKYTDRQMAIKAAKYFVIDIDRDVQTPFITFNGLKDHEDAVIVKAQNFVEKNYHNKLSVDDLAERFNLTRRTFERRFKKATRKTVAEYIQCVKIEAAKKQLEIGRKAVNEIMQDVGYTDVQTFRDVFKKISGMSPIAYREKYSK